jgi:hypothetical protein
VEQRFTLKSTELRSAPELHCESAGVVPDGALHPRIYVLVNPPVPAHVYDTPNDLDTLVLAPRHKGSSLYPSVSEWPCYVYVCLPSKTGDWKAGPFDILDWAVISKESDLGE